MFPSNQALSARPRRRRRRAARGMNRARTIQAIPSNQVARVGRNSGRRRRGNRAQLRNVELIPSAVINRSMTLQPSFSGRGGTVVVTHREYFRTLSSALTEVFTSDKINPCNPNLFPWLSMVAPSWERYRFKALSFSFKTSCSTQTAGDMALAIDYDVRDSIPTDFGEFSSHEGCVTGNYYGNLVLASIIKNFDKKNRGWYLTAEADQTTEMAEFYGGQFETYTGAAVAAAPVGKLYVDYVIEFNNPQPRDYNGYTKVDLTSDLTVNSGQNLVTNYVTQSGVANTTGDDIRMTSTGLEILKAGDYIMNMIVGTTSDTSVLTPSVTGKGTIFQTIANDHDGTSDTLLQTLDLKGMAKGDKIDWAVTIANLVFTGLTYYWARYRTSNY